MEHETNTEEIADMKLEIQNLKSQLATVGDDKEVHIHIDKMLQGMRTERNSSMVRRGLSKCVQTHWLIVIGGMQVDPSTLHKPVEIGWYLHLPASCISIALYHDYVFFSWLCTHVKVQSLESWS